MKKENKENNVVNFDGGKKSVAVLEHESRTYLPITIDVGRRQDNHIDEAKHRIERAAGYLMCLLKPLKDEALSFDELNFDSRESERWALMGFREQVISICEISLGYAEAIMDFTEDIRGFEIKEQPQPVSEDGQKKQKLAA